MFARIMAVVIACIVLLTVCFGALSAITVRNQQINARLDALTREAREIAFLAANNQSSSMAIYFGYDDDIQKYIDWKAANVWNTFGGYILVVDRLGRVMDNLSLAMTEDPDFVSSLNGNELSEALVKVLSGEEVSVRVLVNGSPTFTVGVPFVRNEKVLGAVLIRTRAQAVEGGISELLWPMLLVVLLITVAAGIAVFFFIRSLMKPLRTLTGAARAISEGDFSVRVENTGSMPETEELYKAFNTMTERISQNDANRREFVANVSHELRSPITSISGFVQGMLDGTIPQEEHEHYLHVVEDETGRLKRLISDLLALSRLEREDAALTLEDFDICELSRQAVIRRVADLEAKKMDLVCDFDPDPLYVHADRDRIEQVVINLLDNAIKFTSDGGRIELRAHRQGEKCTMEVRDNGIGIAEEDRPKIFERFFTVDRAHTSGKGTGLGLSICQRILQMHGESIRLLDTTEGAAFAFTLRAGGEVRKRREESEGEDRDEGHSGTETAAGSD